MCLSISSLSLSLCRAVSALFSALSWSLESLLPVSGASSGERLTCGEWNTAIVSQLLEVRDRDRVKVSVRVKVSLKVRVSVRVHRKNGKQE